MVWNEFTAFLMALVLLYDPIKRLGKVHVNMQPIQASAERIFELIDTPLDVTDCPAAIEMAAAPQDIVFEDVSFRYGDSTVLRNIDLHVKAGEKIALVGASGSGKTTLVSLLLRFFDVSEGGLLMDGRDVRDYTMASLRRHIGLVTQDTFLFNNTVANNIRYGTPDATDAEVIHAAEQAHAHQFIVSHLESGYETMVGSAGNRLSGGQRQRIALARAILRNPSILILDEATSQVDLESEQLIQNTLAEFIKGRTTFIITHRLGILAIANRIVVMEEGKIQDVGTHAELMSRSQIYNGLYQSDLPNSA